MDTPAPILGFPAQRVLRESDQRKKKQRGQRKHSNASGVGEHPDMKGVSNEDQDHPGRGCKTPRGSDDLAEQSKLGGV